MRSTVGRMRLMSRWFFEPMIFFKTQLIINRRRHGGFLVRGDEQSASSARARAMDGRCGTIHLHSSSVSGLAGSVHRAQVLRQGFRLLAAAMASISTRAPFGSAATWMVERAGKVPGK